MTIESDFLSLMTSVVKLYAPSAPSAYGGVTFSSSTEVRAHISVGERVTRNADGEEVVAAGRIYLYGTPTVDDDYEIELPSGERVHILSIQTHYDEAGPHHTMVNYGR